jgi:hypothetical protein
MNGVSTPDFFQRVRGFGLESELPVFVVGLPRSGTTLIEQIPASHSQVLGVGEIKLASDTMAALGGQGADPIEAFAGWTTRRPAASLRGTWKDFTGSVARRFASWTRRRITTCFSVCWRACFLGRS